MNAAFIMTASHQAEIEFPIAGALPYLNRVQVIAYPSSRQHAISCSYRDRLASIKEILGHSRSDEDPTTLDIDVVVRFSDPRFDGQSYGLALALADKLARFGNPTPYHRIVATGVLTHERVICRVEGFAEKLKAIAEHCNSEALFIFPKENQEKESILLTELNISISQCAVSQLDDLCELWQACSEQLLPSQYWRLFWRGAIFGFGLVLSITCVLILFS
ncbi:MAG: hypothetical protein HC808_19715 [Candidatus Competibacteraceae bacterium]|nr:hypothetical protein [Candidatus Competibacteraceae bacterium]